MKHLKTQVFDAVTIDSAKQTASVYCPEATNIVFSVVASSASSPTGTTIQIQGSVDGTNWHNLDSTVSVTGNGAFVHHIAGNNSGFLYYRLSYLRSSGSYIATTTAVFKGD